MTFWLEVKKLKGQTLKTLDRGNRFDILEVTEHDIFVKLHETSKDRSIPRKEIEGAWKELTVFGQITRTQIDTRRATLFTWRRSWRHCQECGIPSALSF